MVDLDLFQKGFLLKWGENLINPEPREWKISAQYFFKQLGGLTAFKSNIDIQSCKGLDSIKSYFWKRVFISWVSSNENNIKADKCPHPTDPLFNNKDVKFKGKVLFMPELIKRGVSLIGHITKNGKILKLQEIIRKFGTYPGLMLDYNIMANALTKLPERLTIGQDHKNENQFYYCNLSVGDIGRKKLMNLNRVNSQPTSSIYWESTWGVKYDKIRWAIPFNASKEVKLRILQYKISHRIYPSASLLFKMGIEPSPNCKSCNTLENLNHLFYECPRNKLIWSEIEKYITIQTGKILRLNSNMVVHGLMPQKLISPKELNIINRLILLGKMVISKRNFIKENIKDVLEKEYRQRFFKN